MNNLSYQDQSCELTLLEGIEEYHHYLSSIGREIMRDNEESSLNLDHDATHVIFGLDTSLEQEALLDTWVLWGCAWKFRYILEYFRLPEIKRLTKALYKELGWLGFLRLYWNVLPSKFKILIRCKQMKKKWNFNFSKSLLATSIVDLRKEYGIKILSKEERAFLATIEWSGVY